MSRRLSKKLVPALEDIEAALILVNATDPQYATYGVFYNAVKDLKGCITILNKCDKVDGWTIREITNKLKGVNSNGEVIPAAITTGRGLAEIKYRLSQWLPGVKIAVLGCFNSGKTSLINTLTGKSEPVGDILGTILELTTHRYGDKTLIDTVGQVIDVSKPMMVSIDLSDCVTPVEKLMKCLNEDKKAISLSIKTALPELEKAVYLIIERILKGGKLIVCGAGASALVAMEIAGQAQEIGMPVLIFTNNFTTCQPISFAKGAFEDELAMAEYINRAVEINDVILGISASGGTGFVIKALAIAKESGATTIAITENSDTPLGHVADIAIKSNAKPEGPSSSKIQVAHLAIGHALIITIADIMNVNAETAIKYMLPNIIPNKKMGIK
jgi:D-arabinose 5-phosphate isomerase GutQ